MVLLAAILALLQPAVEDGKINSIENEEFELLANLSIRRNQPADPNDTADNKTMGGTFNSRWNPI